MLSTFATRKFEALFDHLDLNDDQVIDTEDFRRYAARMQAERGWSDDEPKLTAMLSATHDWWTDMIKRAGGDDQKVTRQEWLSFWEAIGQEFATTKMPPPWALTLCQRTHQALDLNGDGTVNAEEYAAWLRAIGSKADPAAVFAKLDLNGDGVVNVVEMMGLFGQFAVSEDPADPGNYLMTGTF